MIRLKKKLNFNHLFQVAEIHIGQTSKPSLVTHIERFGNKYLASVLSFTKNISYKWQVVDHADNQFLWY